MLEHPDSGFDVAAQFQDRIGSAFAPDAACGLLQVGLELHELPPRMFCTALVKALNVLRRVLSSFWPVSVSL